MPADRPVFRPRVQPPEIRAQIGVMALLAALTAALLFWRARVEQRASAPASVVVEVAGEVPAPGYYPLSPPARVSAALAAAGLDPRGFADATLDAGARVVVAQGAWRLEPMRERLVFGLPIDLNQASQEALEAIPGLGPTRAAAIIADRTENGPFTSVADLERVRGIGPATREKLEEFVSVNAASLTPR